MKFEEAMVFLRNGKQIHRSSCEEKGSLFSCNGVDCSFYMTLWDVLAEDWVSNEINGEWVTNKVKKE